MQLKAFARQDGAILALLWVASFVSMLKLPESMLSNVLTLLTPVLVGWRLIKFRNYALDGYISYRRSYAFCFYTFVYASILFAAVQWIYFEFLDKGVFAAMLTSTLNAIAPLYKESGMDFSAISESLSAFTQLSAIEKAFTLFIQNVFVGLFAAAFIAVAGIYNRRNVQHETS